MTNLDTVGCVRHSHVQRGGPVEGCGVAEEDSDVFLRRVTICLITGQHLGPVVEYVHMGLVEACSINVTNVYCDVIVQNRCAPRWAADIPSHIRGTSSHVMLAAQVQSQVERAVSNFQCHVTCRISVEVDGSVEVKNGDRNALCGVLNSDVCFQVPLVRVIHHKETVVKGLVEESGIHCQPILDFVCLVAGAVEVESYEIPCHIESDINGFGDGNEDIINRGGVLVVGTNAYIPAIHLFSFVRGDIAEEPPFVACSRSRNGNGRLVRVFVWLREVDLHF